MKKKSGIILKLALIAALAVIAFASCDINAPAGTTDGLNSELSEKSLKKPAQALDAAGNPLPARIAGTAGIGADAFFFEFDVTGGQKFARVFVPVSPDGFLKNGKMLYKKERYLLTSLTLSPASSDSGYPPSYTMIAGTTASVAGTSYAFQGLYSKETGFFGNIQKIVNGVVQGGESDFFGGLPIFAGKDVENYIGYASFHFDSDTTALIFNALIDSRTGGILGTWCETKPGLGNIHGTIEGTRNGNKVTFAGAVLDMYKSIDGLYLDTMSADGEGWFKNKGEKTIAGSFTIHWVGYDWPSDFVAIRAED